VFFGASQLQSSGRPLFVASNNIADVGFRVAMIVPEPSSAVLAAAGLLGVAVVALRRQRVRVSNRGPGLVAG
jgi:hypothetical protein